MNYLKLKSKYEVQMNLLIDFLPYCDNKQQRFKILDEVQELKYKIQRIDRMPAKYDSVNQRTELRNSEMNFEQQYLKIA